MVMGNIPIKMEVFIFGYWIDDIQFCIRYEIWEDTSQYSGEYFNGKKDGVGNYLREDGKKYIGEWKENNIEGFGIYKILLEDNIQENEKKLNSLIWIIYLEN